MTSADGSSDDFYEQSEAYRPIATEIILIQCRKPLQLMQFRLSASRIMKRLCSLVPGGLEPEEDSRLVFSFTVAYSNRDTYKAGDAVGERRLQLG